MDYSQCSYPRYETPLLHAYGGRFEAAFIALHPFFRMPTSIAWESIDQNSNYPHSSYVRRYGQPVYWQTIMQGIGCEDLRQFYIGMQTSILALQREYEDREMARLINEYTEQASVYHPDEGFNAPLLIEPIARYVSHEKTDEMFYLAEFAEEPEVLTFEEVIQKCDERWLRGSLFDVDITRLATVDWDDFFTVIYGSRSELMAFLKQNPLEGFFCDDQTQHGWCWQDKALKLVIQPINELDT
jgi:hypothetical protein